MLGARVMLDVHDLMTANHRAKFNAGEDDLPVKILLQTPGGVLSGDDAY